jgi:hypothetical protein
MHRNIETIATGPLVIVSRKLASLAAASVVTGCLLALGGCSGAGAVSDEGQDPAAESTEVGTTSAAIVSFGCFLSTQVALQASNNQYVVAEGGGGGVVNANRTNRGAWETFTVQEDLVLGKVSFQASNGKWVVAEGGGGREVLANRSAVGAWEKFTPVATTDAFGFPDGKWAFRANNNQYVVAEGGGGGVVNANRNAIGPWERFTVTCL